MLGRSREGPVDGVPLARELEAAILEMLSELLEGEKHKNDS
jgi:hypothetical protein